MLHPRILPHSRTTQDVSCIGIQFRGRQGHILRHVADAGESFPFARGRQAQVDDDQVLSIVPEKERAVRRGTQAFANRRRGRQVPSPYGLRGRAVARNHRKAACSWSCSCSASALSGGSSLAALALGRRLFSGVSGQTLYGLSLTASTCSTAFAAQPPSPSTLALVLQLQLPLPEPDCRSRFLCTARLLSVSARRSLGLLDAPYSAPRSTPVSPFVTIHASDHPPPSHTVPRLRCCPSHSLPTPSTARLNGLSSALGSPRGSSGLYPARRP